jgi:hypothetical protein
MSQCLDTIKSAAQVSRISIEIHEIRQPKTRRASKSTLDTDGDGGDLSNE